MPDVFHPRSSLRRWLLAICLLAPVRLYALSHPVQHGAALQDTTQRSDSVQSHAAASTTPPEPDWDNPNFSFADNGVTILCAAAANGETGTYAGGVTYTKRTAVEIKADETLASTSCTSGETDFSSLLRDKVSFNDDISHWDVSSVTRMSDMFAAARAFDQDISAWDVSNVTNMWAMFEDAVAFNGAIGGWNVGSVTTMNYMFKGASAFNQDIGGWDVSKVTGMFGMFERASAFNQDIGAWDVSKVEAMAYMFNQASAFNQDIGGWDVSSVTNMNFMFMDASSFDQDISMLPVFGISSAPFGFSDRTSGAWTSSEKPQWGSSHFPVAIRGGAGFRLMSSPVSGTVLSDLLDELWTQGMTGADATTGDPNVWVFDDGTDGGSGSSRDWTAVSDLGAQSLAAGEGVLVYVFADGNVDGVSDLPFVLDVSGSPNSGSAVTISSIGADEWILAGNPYGVALDSDGFVFNGVQNVVYVYDHSYTSGQTGGSDAAASPVGGWRTWNGTAGSLAGGVITPYQGYFVKGTSENGGTGSLTMDDVGDAAATYGRMYKGAGEGSPASGYVTLRLHTVDEAGRRLMDEAFVTLNAQGQAGADPFDAQKMTPLMVRERPFLAMEQGGDSWSTMNLPFEGSALEHGALEIPLQMLHLGLDGSGRNVPLVRQAQLHWDVSALPAHVDATLHDAQTGASVDLRDASSYEFTTSADNGKAKSLQSYAMSYSALEGARFTLRVNYEGMSTGVEDPSPGAGSLPMAVELMPNYPNPFNPATTIAFGLPEATGHVSLQVYDMTGRLVASPMQGAALPAGWHRVAFDGSALSSGVYTYVLRAGGTVQSQRFTLLK